MSKNTSRRRTTARPAPVASRVQTREAAVEVAPQKVRNVRGMGKARSPRDFYETPYECALGICKRLALAFGDTQPARIIEPSAGSGSFVRAAREVWPNATILAIDIQKGNEIKLHKSGATSVAVGDWLQQDPVTTLESDLIVGNPPFSESLAHLLHALRFTQATVAFLLPVTFMASRARADAVWAPDKHLNGSSFSALVPRPGFTSDGGTDMTEYGLYTFRPGLQNVTPDHGRIYPPIVWRAPRGAKE